MDTLGDSHVATFGSRLDSREHSSAVVTVSPPIRIYALGRLEIVIDGAPLRFSRCAPRKPLELLKTLLALGGRCVNRSAVCDAIWADSDAHDAYRSLITTVYRLRGLLRHKHAVTFSGARLSLDARACWVDAWEFERAAAEPRDPTRLEHALALYRGRFLGDDEHPHAFEARNRLHRKLVRAAIALGDYYESSRQPDIAIALYERLLDAEPTSEELHARLISCLLRADQAAAAAVAYQRCRRTLATRLGRAPSSAIENVFRQVCAHQSARAVTRPLPQSA